MRVLCRRFTNNIADGTHIVDIGADGERMEHPPEMGLGIKEAVMQAIAILPNDADWSVCYTHGANVYGEPNVVDLFIRYKSGR